MTFKPLQLFILQYFMNCYGRGPRQSKETGFQRHSYITLASFLNSMFPSFAMLKTSLPPRCKYVSATRHRRSMYLREMETGFLVLPGHRFVVPYYLFCTFRIQRASGVISKKLIISCRALQMFQDI